MVPTLSGDHLTLIPQTKVASVSFICVCLLMPWDGLAHVLQPPSPALELCLPEVTSLDKLHIAPVDVRHRSISYAHSVGQGTVLPSEPENRAGAIYCSGVEYFPAMHKVLASISSTSQTKQTKEPISHPLPGLLPQCFLLVCPPPTPDLSSPGTLFLALHRVSHIDTYSPNPAALRALSISVSEDPANYLHQSAASAEGS